MQELISVKWNVVKFSPETINLEIEEILDSRFQEIDKDLWFKDLLNPYDLKDMDKAVERIKIAKEKNERVIIFWDYDVDWVTSTSLLVHFFTKIGIQTSYRLPHRVNDWYWLKTYFIDELEEINVNLIITVDCWSRDIDVVKYAREKNIDVIITDHHTVPEIIPEDAIALVNPKREDCNYENKNLSWAGVAFKLLQALAPEFLDEKEAEIYIKESIDIAALWTVADCMEITWENRIIVKEWLKQIKSSRSIWLRRLVEDKYFEEIDADIFSFNIWPKLNAAWRLDTPYKAVNLILNNSHTIDKTIFEIEKLNERRKYLTTKFYEDALLNMEDMWNIIFYVSKDIEHWIIGIVAGRLTENYYRPCICLKDEWDVLVASCRSPEFFSIIDLLEKYKDYFLRFWWHKQAAGFSIAKDKFEEFKKLLAVEINKEDFSKYKKEIKIDKVIDPNDIWYSLINRINEYKPFGSWNPKPVFMIEDLRYDNIEYLRNWKAHIRFANSAGFKIMAFGMGDYYDEIVNSNKKVNIIFEINEDNWNWSKWILLNVIDIILV